MVHQLSLRFWFTTLLAAVTTCLSFVRQAAEPVTLPHRQLDGYVLLGNAGPKPTLHVVNEATEFALLVKPGSARPNAARPASVDFAKETVLGVVPAKSSSPRRLAISRVYVQGDQLTVRYTRQSNSSDAAAGAPAPTTSDNVGANVLLLAVPKQPNVVSARLIENGRIVQTLKLPATGE